VELKKRPPGSRDHDLTSGNLMAELTRFDVVTYGDVLFVVVESSLLPPDSSVVVIPLLQDYPAVQLLNPQINFDGKPLILATRMIAAIRRAPLRHIGSVAHEGKKIIRAVDVLMTGF
jgi:toxin CcdB